MRGDVDDRAPLLIVGQRLRPTGAYGMGTNNPAYGVAGPALSGGAAGDEGHCSPSPRAGFGGSLAEQHRTIRRARPTSLHCTSRATRRLDLHRGRHLDNLDNEVKAQPISAPQ